MLQSDLPIFKETELVRDLFVTALHKHTNQLNHDGLSRHVLKRSFSLTDIGEFGAIR